MKRKYTTVVLAVAMTTVPHVAAHGLDANRKSLDGYIGELIAASESSQSEDALRTRIVGFGAPAVERLVPLLDHKEARIQRVAGLTLAQFTAIEPRYLPRLIAADRRGNGWLPRAIAATGTSEALDYLWLAFERDPNSSSNSQVLRALPRFGEQLKPRLLSRIEACRVSTNGKPCEGIHDLLGQLRPPYPAWSIAPIAKLVTDGADQGMRTRTLRVLAGLRYPIALEEYHRQLTEFAHAKHGTSSAWQTTDLMRDIGKYGDRARMAGPTIERFLDRHYDPEIREQAALALGRVGYAAAIPSLMRAAVDFEDEWLLAYNTTQTLGVLRATSARGLLARTARNHWHMAVRRSAEHALRRINGGIAPSKSNEAITGPSFLEGYGPEHAEYQPRWQGSTSDDPLVLRAPMDELPVPRIGARKVNLPGPTSAIPKAAIMPMQEGGGRVSLLIPWNGGWLVGTNNGEWGGSLQFVNATRVVRLATDNVIGGFSWGGRLYVLSGIQHLSLDLGRLWEVDLKAGRLKRNIRLPAMVTEVVVTDRDAVILRTRRGDVAIKRTGAVARPERY